MTDLVDQLYYLAFNPLVTPGCLIDNVKLPNYQNLTFRKNGQGLMAIMECTLSGHVIEFRYYFDDQDHLNRAVSINRETNDIEIIFDRAQELKNLEDRIVRSRNHRESTAV